MNNLKRKTELYQMYRIKHPMKPKSEIYKLVQQHWENENRSRDVIEIKNKNPYE